MMIPPATAQPRGKWGRRLAAAISTITSTHRTADRREGIGQRRLRKQAQFVSAHQFVRIALARPLAAD